MAKLLTSILLLVTLMAPKAHASDGEQFFTTVIYGTVAGALVGVATLAFSSSPGDNLMNIARGASLGLYAGILLGGYLYSQSGSDGLPIENVNPDGLPPPDNSAPQGLFYKVKKTPLYGFSVYPTVQKGTVGVGVNFLNLNF